MTTASEVVGGSVRKELYIGTQATHGPQVPQATQGLSDTQRRDAAFLRAITGKPSVSEAVTAAIGFVLPQTECSPVKAAWLLARALKTVCNRYRCNPTQESLQVWFTVWFEDASAWFSTTVHEESLWLMFLEKWDVVKWGLGVDPVESAWLRALKAPPPACASVYVSRELTLVVTLVCEMQRDAGLGTWYLSARGLAKLFKHPTHTTAALWLRSLVKKGILALASQGVMVVNAEGKVTKKRASEYRYLHPLDT